MAGSHKRYSNRWFLRQAVVLFGIAMVLSCLSLSNFVSQWFSGVQLLPDQIDQGWATLLGAIFGLSVVGMQARHGLRRLRQSQINQAQLDRSSRDHQAVLDRAARRDEYELQKSREEEFRTEKKRAVAASINGELLAIHTFLSHRAVNFRYQATIYESLPPDTTASNSKIFWSGAATDIFDHTIGDLGILGASVCGDVIQVFQTAKVGVDIPAEKINAGMLAAIYRSMADAWTENHEDILHLQKRLVAIQLNEKDPGPLFFAKQERQRAKSSTERPS